MGDNPNNNTTHFIKTELNIDDDDDDDDNDDIVTVTQNPANDNIDDKQTTEVLAEPLPITIQNGNGEKATKPQQRNKGGRKAIIRQQRPVPANNNAGQNVTTRQQQNVPPRQDKKTNYFTPKPESTSAPKQQQRRVPLNKLIRQKTNLEGQDEKPKYYIPKREQTGAPKQQQQQPRISLNNRQHVKPSISAEDTTHIVWSDTESEDGKTEDDKSKNNERRFRPKLYDFLIDDYDMLRETLIENERKFNDNVTIRCPDFAILLDHIIAVVWYFYRDWRTWNYLNVSQLEWTIKFLDGILSCQICPHIQIIKQHLEELLIIKYAEVPECFVSIPEPRPPQNYRCGPEIPFSLQAVLQPAPDFQQYLSTEIEPGGFSRITSNTELAEYADARIQLMKSELEKLNALRRDHANVTPDTAAAAIIKNILHHADEVLRVRELENH